jgi:hypothetical protein
MPVKISNRKIAEILKLPRTQVESALRSIKNTFLSGEYLPRDIPQKEGGQS